jgi:broad specificity phosphatase PhoE
VRELDVRRHSKRARPEQHLTRAGVALARRVGNEGRSFDLVVTSPLARCVETAVALGHAVDFVDARLAGPDGTGETFPQMDEIDWSAGRSSLATLIDRNGPCAEFARAQASIWREVAARLADNGRALVVTHGGAFLDGAALVLSPETVDLRTGAPSSYCEGFRLRFDGNAVVDLRLLRVAADGA